MVYVGMIYAIIQFACYLSLRSVVMNVENAVVPNHEQMKSFSEQGPDQAIYLYSVEDYAWWAEALGQDVPAGTFGENFTTSGQDLCGICVGDVLVSESVTLQVSAPRIPCSTLASRMGDKQFAKKFMKAGRSGAYCRVLETGDVQAGDEYAHRPYDGDRIPLQTFFKEAHSKLSVDQLRRYLAAPIDERTRRDFSRKMAASS